jgi:ATP-dependent Clp protease ATP-binding subunit ClpC
LERKHIFDIIDIQLEELRERLKVNSMFLELSDEAKDFLVEKGFDKKFGARPLRRALQKYVEDDLADRILRNNLQSGYKITGKLAPAGDKLDFVFTEIEVIDKSHILPAGEFPDNEQIENTDKSENAEDLSEADEHKESNN